MAHNTPTDADRDGPSTDLTAASIWRATRYSIFSQRRWKHPINLPRYTAYAKLTQEQEGQQITLKRKILVLETSGDVL